MQCKNCGTLLSADAEVCVVCGTPVEKNVEQLENTDVNVDGLEQEILEGNEVVVEESATIVPPIQNTEDNLVQGVAMFNNFADEAPRKSRKGIVLLVIAIVVALVGLLGFVFYLMKSPKMIFNNFINKIYKEAEIAMVDFNTMRGALTVQTNISTANETNAIFEIVNDVFVGIDYELDYDNKTALTKITTKYGDEKLLDLDVYLKDSTGYILLNNLYSKYISVDLKDIADSIFESVKYTEDHKIVLGELKTAVTKSLKSKYFSTETEEITINDTKVKTTKNSLELDNINIITKDILTYLTNSDKFITSASKVSNVTESEILSGLEDSLNYLEEDPIETTYEDAQLSIYTKGLMNEVVRVELSMKVDSVEEYLNITIEDDDTFSIELSSSDASFVGKVKMNENDGKDIIYITLTDSTDTMTFGLTLSSYVEYNKNLSSVNVSNSVDFNDLTEEDYNEISTKLMESPGIQKLMEAIGNLSYGYEEPELECGEGIDCYYEDDEL